MKIREIDCLNNYQDYALPVEHNVDYIRKIPSISKQTSFIVNQHPAILDYFNEIIGSERSILSPIMCQCNSP